MKNFKILNSITGWLVFFIATTVYILTIEPTASFWDCGEFISSAFKLEVGHPPGAPFFMLMGRIASLFAGGNVEMVAKTVNMMSALASSFTILFLFWSITHLAKKIVGKKEEYSLGETIGILGSGIVGALAYTFSDTFWFSAVEGEVYATSSLFTALVFWAILKWEDVADEKYSNRWLVLIAYLMGLSIGVHLLNLLAIPAIVLVYYFKKYKVTPKGVLLVSILSFIILGFIMYGLIQGIITVASWFELLFVNSFGLPYKSGLLFVLAAFIALIVMGLMQTRKSGNALWNTIILCFAVILLGYSSYAAIVIRSSANPPMDQNNPETMFSLKYYLDREQYGDRPLIYGPYYNAPMIRPHNKAEEEKMRGAPVYTAQDGKYVVSYYKPKYKYNPDFYTLFPRMYSNESNHVSAYKEWGGKGKPIRTKNDEGEMVTLNRPTFLENMKFFFSYQVFHMYVRYFMWNYSGRQNDIQGHGGNTKGQWLSGIKFLDEWRLGPQDNLPSSLKNNKARNVYYMLPLILGLVGFMTQLQKHKKDFVVVSLLFFMTGIAIVIYLNQTPYQPRERDYAYAGSFYAFAIWIGLGVLGLIQSLSKKLPAAPSAILVTMATLVLVPGIMANENWDDHDRSGRYTARDFAYNYLNSCDKDAIIFTNGDNDTFPLWYAQEVEGIRTDVRVINLSYLGADWYIEQMYRKAYESDPIPFSLTQDKYRNGKRDAVYIFERIKDYVDLKQAMDFLASDNPETKMIPNYGELDYFPTRKVKIPVDSAKVMATGTVSKKWATQIVPEVKMELKGNAFYKNDMMVLDLLAHNNWQRPIYFAITVSDDNYASFQKYFQLTGLAYKFVPVEYTRPDGQSGSIDTDILYENLMNKFKWGNISDPKVYLDENNLRMLSNFRNNFARLAEALLDENKVDSAVKVIDRSFEVMPPNQVPLNYWTVPIIEQYYRAKQIEKGNKYAEALFNIASEELKYYFSLGKKHAASVDYEKRINMHILNELMKLAEYYKQTDLKNKIELVFQTYYSRLMPDNE
jgi:hypothetical protein